MIPWEMWEMSELLVWDVTGVDALSPSRLHQDSLCNPGTTANEAEAHKIEKYREIIDNGYFFTGGHESTGFFRREPGFSIPIRLSIPIPDSQALDSRSPIPNFANSIFDSRFRFPGRRINLIQGPRQKTGRFQLFF